MDNGGGKEDAAAEKEDKEQERILKNKSSVISPKLKYEIFVSIMEHLPI